MFLHQFVALGGLEVLAHHLADQLVEADPWRPAELGLGLAWVAQQGFDFGGAEVARVDGNDALAPLSPSPSPARGRGGDEVALLVDALAFPADGHAEFLGCGVDEVAHRILHAGGDDEVFRLLLLQHQPLHLDVVLGVAPVTLGVHVAEEEAVLQPELDPRQGAGDLAGDEGFAAVGALVVEQDAVAGIHPVRLAVVDGDPVGVELGHRVGAPRIEGGGLLLRDLLHQAVELGGGRLVETGFLFQAQDADRLEDAQRAEGVGVGGVFGFLEGNGDVALRGEVVDLVGLHLLDDADQARRIGEVAVVQDEAAVLLVRILVQVVDAIGVEQRGAALDAVDFVALVQQEFGEVGAVLAGDAGDEGFFHITRGKRHRIPKS